MKKIIYYLVALVVVTGLISCAGNKADRVASKWKISDIILNREIPTDQKAMADERINEMKKTSYFDFHKDGSFESLMFGQREKGTWKLSDDGNKLLIKRDGKDKGENIINLSEISSNKMTIEMDEHGEKIKFLLIK